MDGEPMTVIEWEIAEQRRPSGEAFFGAAWRWPETGERARVVGKDYDDAMRRMRLAWWRRYGDRVFEGQDLPDRGDH